MDCFDGFYKQVLKHKKFVASKPWEKSTEESTSSPNATAEHILSSIQTFLEEQAMAATYGGNSFSEGYYSDAQFIMVALADEVFLNLDWPGKKYWESNLLEQRFYGTHSAGQTFFEKLDVLLENKDPVQIDIGLLYLSALALGFQGKYRHFNGDTALAAYRKKLFVFINRRNPTLFRKNTHLFSEAYTYTLEGNQPKELPTLRNWYFVFFGMVFSYLFVSYIIWYSGTAEVSGIVNRIITYSNMGG